jgi:hypothetical protein
MSLMQVWHSLVSRLVGSTQRPNLTNDLVFAGLAAWCGFFAPIFAFDMAGGGHGWTSPLLTSCIGLLTGPLTGFAWFRRHDRLGRALAIILLCILVTASVRIIWHTKTEERPYFIKVWKKVPWEVSLFAATWLYCPMLLVAILFGTILRWRSSGGPMES